MVLIELPRWLADQAPVLVGLPFAIGIYLLALYTRKHAHDPRD